MSEFDKWDSFYVIIGSAAGALIGLQFVVMTLLAERPPQRAAEAGAAFSTPTIVHFSAVLLLSAVLRAPWEEARPADCVFAALGLLGLCYALLTAWRMHAQAAYKPDFEDWLCHALLPLAGYALLTASSLAAFSHTREALFGIAGAALILLFLSIHNAWDAVAYHVLVMRGGNAQDKQS